MKEPEENKEYEPDYFLGEDNNPSFDEEFLQDNWDEIREQE